MERLIHSNPIPSSKLHHHLNPLSSPFLHLRLRRFDAGNFVFPSSLRTESRRVNSFSCKHQDPSSISSPSSLYTDKSHNLSLLVTSPVNLPDDSAPKSHFIKQIVGAFSEHQKVLVYFPCNLDKFVFFWAFFWV